MCGLAGVAALRGELGPEAESTAAGMGRTLRHRGPDGAGTWSDQRVALAHQRLAILDLSEAGAQPMISASRRYVVVFNGEIYNYRDLGDELRRTGWRSRSNSDTEVLLAAVEGYGLDRFLQRADGMFAFALYDREKGRLALARDRFGEKPVAYCLQGNQLFFASELRAFETVPGLELSLDAAATADYFRYGHIPGRRTMFAGIHRVRPATVVEFDLNKGGPPQERTYWKPAGPPKPAGRTAADNDESPLRELLSISVRNRLVSDRPIGAFLSGGIDSSVVSALAAEHTTGALKTFTMGWDDVEYDESQQAARVASALGADHHDVRLGRTDMVNAVHRLGHVMDEPFADSSQLAVLLVASAAREDVVVALSGDGGDELFAGYNRHRWLLSTRRVSVHAPAWMRRLGGQFVDRAAPLIEKALSPIPPTRRPRLVADKVRKIADVVAAPSLVEAYQLLLTQDATLGKARRLDPRVEEGLAAANPDTVLWGLRVADMQGFLVDDVLTKVDRATMAVSLESRTPFLHAGLADLALGLGAERLIGRSGAKLPLRSLLDTLLPGVSFNQTKAGFGVPVASILRTELLQTLTDAVSTHVSRCPPVEVDWPGLVARLARGDDAPAPMLWSLLMFELWAAQRRYSISWK